MLRLLLFSLLLVFSSALAAQNNDYRINKGSAFLFQLGYAAHQPGGDMSLRYGRHFSLNGGVDYISTESNWIFGFGYNYYFGNEVRENVLANIVTDQGFIIGNDRDYADIQLRMRGFYAGLRAGKLFSIGLPNPRSGIRVTVGAGLLQHRIRVQDDPVRQVPQLSDEYKKGYDRLSNGLALSQFIGYQVLSRNRRVNFYAGLELTQAFTQNRRDFNFDTMTKDETARVDLLTGLRLAWIVPLYFGQLASEEVYY